MTSRSWPAVVAALALLVGACNPPSGSSPASSPGASAPPAASPSMGTPVPAASLDPSMTADELFAEDAVAADLDVAELGRETRGEAVVRDLTFVGSRGSAVSAYVVVPATGAPRAGVLFLHWLGEFESNREEFLDEAIELASDGVASVLIDQTFPWTARASGLEHDRVQIGYQVRGAWRGLAVLAEEVESAPLAVVGHDFGGMYAAILRGLEPRLAAVVIMASTGAWADWFVKFVNVVPASEAPAYRAGLEDVDPITWLARPAESAVLLQLSSFDVFVSASDGDALLAAAGPAAEARRYDAGHELDDAARVDRDAWLLDHLDIR